MCDSAGPGDWVMVKGPFAAAELRALKQHGPIDRLSITRQPLVTAAVARGLEDVVSVDRLWLWCGITRTAMRHVVAIPGLRVLDVFGLKSPGRLAGFADNTSLQVFRGNLCLSGADLVEVAACPSLTELGAQGGDLTASAFDALLGMIHLETLDLEGTRFDDTMAARLYARASLRRLYVGNTPLTREGLEHIARFRQLRALDIWATAITEPDIDVLAGMPHLEYLSLGSAGAGGGRPAFNAQTLLPRLQAIPSLKHVFLDGVPVTDGQRAGYEEHFQQAEFN